MRRLLREPLVQFLGLGLLLFGAYHWLAGDADGGRRIVLGPAELELIESQFRAAWGRSPTHDEMQGLIDSAVRDEILYREGETLGLGRDDPVVKRRIRQKYEVLAEEQSQQPAPTESDLAAYLAANARRYERPAIVTFEQLLLAAPASAVEPAAAAVEVRRALERGADPATLGRPTLLPAREEAVGLDRVARDYGESFAEALGTMPVGAWQGPVESAYGAHMVRVERYVAGVLPPLEQVRTELTRDFEYARRERALESSLAELRKKYEIVIEPLPERRASQ